MPKYDPFAVRRCVRLTEVVNDEVAVFTTKSFTDPSSTEDKYHPCIDVATRQVACDCPHFAYRLARLNPTVDTTAGHCKHLARAIETMRRRGLL